MNRRAGKICKLVGDVAVSVGCCVGVGFLSGKEAQVFWSSWQNVAVFAVIFAAVTFAVRQQCRRSRSVNVEMLSKSLFSKGAAALSYAIVFCSFACAVTVLAGVQQAMSVMFFPTPLPVFAFVAAVAAALLARAKMSVIKLLNAVAVILSVALVVLLRTVNDKTASNVSAPAVMPVTYALFCVTMSLGVSARLANECTARENLAVSVVSALLLALLMLFVLPLCRFELPLPALHGLTLPAKIFAAITLLIASVTGLAANAVPVCDALFDIVPDKTLCIMLVFCLSLALSMFGFDFAVRYGYVAVAVVGAILTVGAVFRPSVARATL